MAVEVVPQHKDFKHGTGFIPVPNEEWANGMPAAFEAVNVEVRPLPPQFQVV